MGIYPKNAYPGERQGFTLIEALAAIAIIAIGTFVIMGLVMMVVKGNSHSARVTTAVTLVQENMENIKRMGYANIGNNYSSSGTYTAYIKYSWRVTGQDNTPGTDTKTMTAVVYWPPATSTASTHHKVELRTIIAR